MRGARIAQKLQQAKEKNAEAEQNRDLIKENKKLEGNVADGEDLELDANKGYGNDAFKSDDGREERLAKRRRFLKNNQDNSKLNLLQMQQDLAQQDPDVIEIFETEYIKEHANQFSSLFESTDEIIKHQYNEIIGHKYYRKDQDVAVRHIDLALKHTSEPDMETIQTFLDKQRCQYRQIIQNHKINMQNLDHINKKYYESDEYLKFSNQDLTILQTNIFEAVEVGNLANFIDLGAHDSVDLNFFALNIKKQNHRKDQILDEQTFLLQHLKIYPIMSAVTKGDQKMLELMLRNKSLDINVCDSNSGVNAFWLACLYGHGNIMKILAEAGTDIYVTNHRNVNVLHLAILKNHYQIVEMLIQSGFSLTEETSDGSTALHLVALTNHHQIGELILNHLNECGFKQSHVIELISKPNPYTNMSPLGMNILMENNEIATQLIINGAQCYYDYNIAQKDISPIFLACEKENTDLLELMCDHGCPLSVQNTMGQTPLMFASQQKKSKIVNYLSLRTRDLDTEDSNCMTILMQQLFTENLEMASRLIVRGANINYVNSNGQTALQICIDNKNVLAVKLLLQKGAHPHIMDLNGEDACDKAQKNGMIKDFPQFNDCQTSKKIIPKMPNGQHPKFTDLPFFKFQKDEKEQKMIQFLEKEKINSTLKRRVVKNVKTFTTIRLQTNKSSASNSRVWDEISIKSSQDRENQVNNILQRNKTFNSEDLQDQDAQSYEGQKDSQENSCNSSGHDNDWEPGMILMGNLDDLQNETVSVSVMSDSPGLPQNQISSKNKMNTNQIVSQSSQDLDSDDEGFLKNNLNKAKIENSPEEFENNEAQDPDASLQKQNTFTLKSMLSRKIVRMPTTIQGQVMEAIAENSEKTSFVTDSDADLASSPNKQQSPQIHSPQTHQAFNQKVLIQEFKQRSPSPKAEKEKRIFGKMQTKRDPMKLAAQKVSDITSNQSLFTESGYEDYIKQSETSFEPLDLEKITRNIKVDPNLSSVLNAFQNSHIKEMKHLAFQLNVKIQQRDKYYQLQDEQPNQSIEPSSKKDEPTSKQEQVQNEQEQEKERSDNNQNNNPNDLRKNQKQNEQSEVLKINEDADDKEPNHVIPGVDELRHTILTNNPKIMGMIKDKSKGIDKEQLQDLIESVMQNTINHVLKYQETKREEELIEIGEKVSLKNSIMSKKSREKDEEDEEDERVNVEKLYIENKSSKLSKNSKSVVSQVSKSSVEPISNKGEKVEFKKVQNQKSKEQVSLTIHQSPQPKKKKQKNKKYAVKLNKNDEYEFMNLSFGTFGTYDGIDEQVNKAENMIAEFELQLDQAILQLQNKNTEQPALAKEGGLDVSKRQQDQTSKQQDNRAKLDDRAKLIEMKISMKDVLEEQNKTSPSKTSVIQKELLNVGKVEESSDSSKFEHETTIRTMSGYTNQLQLVSGLIGVQNELADKLENLVDNSEESQSKLAELKSMHQIQESNLQQQAQGAD